MKILLTGGSGFLGSYVAEQLTAEGHAVRALVRPKSNKKLLEALPGLELAHGAVDDRDSVFAAVAGVDAVVHVAGVVKAVDAAEFAAVNTQGTVNLLDAAEAKAPALKRFVLVSSLAAIGPSEDGKPVADDAPPHPVTHYGRSKLAAEQAALARKERLPVTIIRPPMIYGPRDTETLAFFTSVKNGVLPLLGDGSNTLSVVYGADAAAAVVRAVTAQVPSGSAFFVEDGKVLVWREALAEVEAALGRRAFVRFGLPMGVVTVAAAATQAWAKVSGKAQMLTLDKVNELKQQHWVCSGEGARKLLGWAPKTSWAEGARLAAEWYRKEGWL